MFRGDVTVNSVTEGNFQMLKKALNLVKGCAVSTPFGNGQLMAVEPDFCLVRFEPGTEVAVQGNHFTMVFYADSKPVKVKTHMVQLPKKEAK